MASEDSSANDSGTVTSPGKLLSEKRKSKKLEEREVAEALKISVSRLRSIENDDLTVFPSETYIRGHLKNYSRLLGCEEPVVLGAYDSIKSELGLNEPDPPLVSENQSSQFNEKNRTGIKWVLLAIFIIIVAAAFWLLAFKPESTPKLDSSIDLLSPKLEIEEGKLKNSNLSSSENVIEPQVALEPVGTLSDAAAKIENVGELAASNVVDAELIDDSQAATPKTTTPETPIIVSKLTASELVESIRQQENGQEDKKQEAPVGDALIFDFNDASWIQVVDAEKKILFKGLNKASAKLALNGSAPFNIVIGNVNGTSLMFNGEPVVLTAPAGKNILRLTLGE